MERKLRHLTIDRAIHQEKNLVQMIKEILNVFCRHKAYNQSMHSMAQFVKMMTCLVHGYGKIDEDNKEAFESVCNIFL